MIRSQKTTKKRQGWLGNARGSGGEAAKARHKMRSVKKLVHKKRWESQASMVISKRGRISVGVDVVSRVTMELSPGKERGPRRKYARGRNRP